MRTVLSFFFLTLSLMGAAQPRPIAVKEFLKLSPGDTTSYVVQGVVSKIRSSSSGSFYLKDNTGTLLVYGIQDPANKNLSFKQLDIVQGDTLMVKGRFTVYNGTTKEMKDGRLLSKANGPDHNLSFYDRLSQKPSFKGKEGKEGVEAFRQWVQSRVKNPSGGKGTVLVRFVVGRNGGVQEVQVEKGASPSLNEEALRVVKSAPKWKPAKSDDGTELRINYTISVVFE